MGNREPVSKYWGHVLQLLPGVPHSGRTDEDLGSHYRKPFPPPEVTASGFKGLTHFSPPLILSPLETTYLGNSKLTVYTEFSKLWHRPSKR